MIGFDHFQRVPNHSQISQPQKIHLKQTKFFYNAHRKLGRNAFFRQVQGNVLIDALLCNDYSRSMSRGVTGFSFQGSCRIDESAHLFVVIVILPKLRIHFQSFVDGHFQVEGNLLGNGIHFCVTHIHCPAHIPNSLFRFHSAESDDLGHFVSSVFFHYVIDNFAPSFKAEININVRHADTLRIEEAFKDESVFDRIDVGNVKAIGNDASGSGTAAGTYHNSFALSVIDEIPDYKEVLHITHRLNSVQFVLQPLEQGSVRLTVAFYKSGHAKLPEIALICFALRCLKFRQMKFSKLKFHVACVCNASSIFQGLRNIGKKPAHFFFGFQIELIVGEPHPVLIVHRLSGLYAKQNIVVGRFLPVYVVNVICGNKRNTCFLPQPLHVRQNFILLLQPLILELQVKIPFSENLKVFQCFGFCPFVIIV